MLSTAMHALIHADPPQCHASLLTAIVAQTKVLLLAAAAYTLTHDTVLLRASFRPKSLQPSITTTPAHLHVAQHARQLLLHQLEGGQRGAKLVPLTQVAAEGGGRKGRQAGNSRAIGRDRIGTEVKMQSSVRLLPRFSNTAAGEAKALSSSTSIKEAAAVSAGLSSLGLTVPPCRRPPWPCPQAAS